MEQEEIHLYKTLIKTGSNDYILLFRLLSYFDPSGTLVHLSSELPMTPYTLVFFTVNSEEAIVIRLSIETEVILQRSCTYNPVTGEITITYQSPDYTDDIQN